MTRRAVIDLDYTVLEPAKTKNTLTVIGWMGTKRAYLNLSREEAIARWVASEGEAEPADGLIDIFEFDDEFAVYDAWSSVDP